MRRFLSVVDNICVITNGMTSSTCAVRSIAVVFLLTSLLVHVWLMTDCEYVGLGVNSIPFSAFRAASSGTTPPSQLLRRLQSTQVIVFDDVQRLSAEQFEVISSVFSSASASTNHDRRPFGGARVLLCGDFLQMGPVPAELSCVYESALWQQLQPTVIYLHSSVRYQHAEFTAFLGSLRDGAFDSEHWRRQLLRRESHQSNLASNLATTEHPILVGTHNEMTNKNREKTDLLHTEQHLFHSTDVGAVHLFEWPVDASVLLKVDMPVMYVGSRQAGRPPAVSFGCIGVVTGLESTHALVRFDEPYGVTRVERCLFGPFLSVSTSEEVLEPTRRQIPLLPAYALTVHKLLGVTLSRGTVAFTKMRLEHQHYSALMLFVGSDRLSIIDPPSGASIRVNPACLAFERHCLGTV